MAILIDSERCINCNTCVEVCVMDILRGGDRHPTVAYPDECWHCGACMMDCPVDAIRIALPQRLKPIAIKVR